MSELRALVAAALLARCQESLPASVMTAWGSESVLVLVEELRFHTPGQAPEGWVAVCGVQGRLIADLVEDGSESLDSSPLLASLVDRPLKLTLDEDAPGGALGWTVTARLVGLRHVVGQASLAQRLSLEITGWLVRSEATPPPALPDRVFVGYVPEVGTGHESDYEEVTPHDP